jgi:hypothetical protein
VKDSLRILRWAILRASGLGRGARWLTGYRRFVANMNFRASRCYQPKPYPETITLFLAGGKTFPPEDRRLLLRPYAKDSTVITIPTGHVGFFVRPAVDELARQLQICLESVEKKNPA